MTSYTRPAALLAAAAMTASISGCGMHDKLSNDHATTTAAPAKKVRHGNPPRKAASNARAAVTEFARQFINWDFKTLPRARAANAQLADGQLRAQMFKEAQSAANDVARSYSTQRSRGTVEGVMLRGADKPILVVTHETADYGSAKTAQSAYQVYLASARKTTAGGWVVTGWRPAS